MPAQHDKLSDRQCVLSNACTFQAAIGSNIGCRFDILQYKHWSVKLGSIACSMNMSYRPPCILRPRVLRLIIHVIIIVIIQPHVASAVTSTLCTAMRRGRWDVDRAVDA